MSRIAIILPAYNEEVTVAQTIMAFHKELPHARIIVVNNNSQDNTVAIAKHTLKELGAIGEVIDEPCQGKGNAIRRAFLDIDADVYVMVDADLTYPAERVHDLMKPILENQADMTVGDRLTGGDYRKENKRHFHGIGNSLVNWSINKLFKSKLQDVMSGYRVFNRRFVKNYPILVGGFQIETDLTLHALDKRFRIKEIPVEYKDRPEGSLSKLNTFADGARVIFTITSILRYYRPLAFFGYLGLVFGLLGIVTSMPVFNDWFQHHYNYHVPLAILAVALELLASISIGIGLILDSITHQHKMNFEKSLLDG